MDKAGGESISTLTPPPPHPTPYCISLPHSPHVSPHLTPEMTLALFEDSGWLQTDVNALTPTPYPPTPISPLGLGRSVLSRKSQWILC